MAKSDKRRLREVRYTGKRRLRGVVFFSGPQQYMWYVEVLIKTYNEGDRTFYDAINFNSSYYASGGVLSQLETTASICTKASIGIAETPIVVLAGR